VTAISMSAPAILSISLSGLLVLSTISVSPNELNLQIAQQRLESQTASGTSAIGSFSHKLIDGRAECLEADIERARTIRERKTSLSIISPNQPPSSPGSFGLKIVLRGTSQLTSFPDAVDAFKRAAARWEALIHTTATVVVDVDFGPEVFDSAQFDPVLVAVTDVQLLRGNALYEAVRSGLTAGPYSPEKRSFYNLLPSGAIPTDNGKKTGIAATSATLRALELIDPVAEPEAELAFGPPPAIAINSSIGFDFNPTDGIEPNKLDFEAIAAHQFGHILGFVSCAGQSESTSFAAVEPSVLDLFRLRPQETDQPFTTVERILSSGGQQVFYDGNDALPFSTGRPDGTTGDLRSASHWKDDEIGTGNAGIMDPTIRFGEHHSITDNDVRALDAIGYRTKSVADPTIVIPLTSGQSQPGNMFAPPASLGLISRVQYSIVVPQAAAELKVALVGNQDVDLFVRFGQKVVLRGHNPVTDHMSTSETGTEIILVTPDSSPPLRAGIYYFAIVNFGPGEANFTINATTTGGTVGHRPAIFDLEANLDGESLTVDCTAIDRDADFAVAEMSLLDDQDHLIGNPSTISVGSTATDRIAIRHRFDGLISLPTARKAVVVLTDGAGNRSAAAVVDFGAGQPGGIDITGASYSGSKLKLRVKGLATELQLEINGRIIERKIKVNGSQTKFTIKGSTSALALQPGANRVRVRNVNGWSNIVVLTL
jgi:hypothetical protein